MRRQYVRDWGDTKPISTADGFVQPLITMQLLLIITRLFALAGTDDARLLQHASTSMSMRSACGLLQFDQFGRMAQIDQYVTQHSADGATQHLITPLDVGQPDVWPLPTWAERIPPTADNFVRTPAERAVMGVSAVVCVYLVALLAGVLWFRACPVIRSSSPGFCSLLLLGATMCACSNFGLSLFAVSAGCASSAWLLTTGFTLMFSALLAKLWRLYRIFESRRLQSVHVGNRRLFAFVAAMVAIDIAVNSMWSGVEGFPVEYVRVDVHRPSRDFVRCAYSPRSVAFVYGHLACKGALIVAGVVLTVLTRNLPSMFNETPRLAAALYNCVLLLLFVLPMVAVGVGGREVSYQLRSYAVLLVVSSTASILFLPKFAAILFGRARRTSALPTPDPAGVALGPSSAAAIAQWGRGGKTGDASVDMVGGPGVDADDEGAAAAAAAAALFLDSESVGSSLSFQANDPFAESAGAFDEAGRRIGANGEGAPISHVYLCEADVLHMHEHAQAHAQSPLALQPQTPLAHDHPHNHSRPSKQSPRLCSCAHPAPISSSVPAAGASSSSGANGQCASCNANRASSSNSNTHSNDGAAAAAAAASSPAMAVQLAFLQRELTAAHAALARSQEELAQLRHRFAHKHVHSPSRSHSLSRSASLLVATARSGDGCRTPLRLLHAANAGNDADDKASASAAASAAAAAAAVGPHLLPGVPIATNESESELPRPCGEAAEQHGHCE